MAEGKKVGERKKFILELLKSSNGMIYTKDIIQRCEEQFGTKLSKPTISDNIRSLRKEGFCIESGNNGYILKGIEETVDIDESESAGYDELSADIVAEWLLLLFFEKMNTGYMSFEEVLSGYCDFAGVTSESKLRRHLESLEKKDYISSHTFAQIQSKAHLDETEESMCSGKLYYHISESAPIPTLIDTDDLREFNSYYFDRGYGTELEETVKVINDKIKSVSSEMYDDVSGVLKTFGRKNDMPKERIQELEAYLRLPFKEQAINIKYREKEKEMNYLFKTALIIFSVETSGFYLMGEVRDGKSRNLKTFRLELVTGATQDKNTVNDIYESKDFKRMYREMWSVVTDKPTHVEIWFEDVPHVRKQIKELAVARKDTAEVTFPRSKEEGSPIKYKDDIIGVHSFMRYVRSMGSSAVIISPKKNREHMIKKTEELLEKYKEIIKDGKI